MTIEFRNSDYQLERYPATDNRSLQPGSAADEHLLRYLLEHFPESPSPVICHDRFGALTVPLFPENPTCVISMKSQLISIQNNLRANGFNPDELVVSDPLAPPPGSVSLALLRVPKSLDLFRHYLYQLSQKLTPESTVLCGFMTRQFSPQILNIAGEYFGSVEQSLAWKKSRLVILTGPKVFQEKSPLIRVPSGDLGTLLQYPGVFSAQRVDSATGFLLQNLSVQESDSRILDLGCGNGIIGMALSRRLPQAEIHLLDDAWLAVESAKLNLGTGNRIYHWADSLKDLRDEEFDMVVSNPPFHTEYEIDISVPLALFKDVKRILKSSGVFLLVSNRHLNYRTHLSRSFAVVNQVASDGKFEVLRCYR